MKPWVHRRKGPIHTVNIGDRLLEGVTIYYRLLDGHVDELCLGERYVHSAPGRWFNHEVWVGSYIDDWHGGIQTHSLQDAARWVAQAEHPELGYQLWMISTTGEV